jgi:unsaturated rhamnogalacturonyl hydrolase
MWLDGIYMAEPFLTDYAASFDQPKWFDEAVFQIEEIYKRTLDQETGLLYHAWDESREQRWSNPENSQSKHFWSRGMGWYVMAIVDVLDYLPKEHPGRKTLIDILTRTCDALLQVRDEKTGLWFQVLDMAGKEGNYIEGSGSAMFIYAYAKGARQAYLPESYHEIAASAFDDMIEVLVEDGEDGFPVLTNVCGGAGLGGNPYREADYAYYINERKVDNDQKGIAPLIMAAIELGK